MLPGSPAPATPAAALPQAAPAPERRATVLGLAPQPPRAESSLTRTVLGLAPRAEPPRAPVPGIPAENPHTKTILGIARPGIAPLNPGVHKADPAPAQTYGYPSPPPPPELSAPPDRTLALPGIADAPPPPPGTFTTPPRTGGSAAPPLGARTLTLRAAKRNSWLAALVISAAFGLCLLATVLFFVFRGPGRIEARVSLAEDGRERLELNCPRCVDGTRVRVAADEARFLGHRATLRLSKPLAVGDNLLTLMLVAPDKTRETSVDLNVPIEYRVRADPTGLSDPKPQLRILIAAVPKSSVTVDRKPVTLDANGRGRVEIDVAAELTGPDASVRRIERHVPYNVLSATQTKYSGVVDVQLRVVPLVVDAPGESITVADATATIAGRTQRGAAVSVAGQPVRVDGEGRFAASIPLPRLGDNALSVRASLADHAPRLVDVRIRRVASLPDEARRYRAEATTSYAAIAAGAERKRGWKVALEGSVLDLKRLEHSTLFLLDTKSGCASAPCLTRAVLGSRTNIETGDNVSVFGHITGAVDGPRSGTRIPELMAEFVLAGKR